MNDQLMFTLIARLVMAIFAVGMAFVAWTAIRRIRQGRKTGWLVLWWTIYGTVMFVLYRPFYHRFRPSLDHWPALLTAFLVTLIWSVSGVAWIAPQLRSKAIGEIGK